MGLDPTLRDLVSFIIKHFNKVAQKNSMNLILFYLIYSLFFYLPLSLFYIKYIKIKIFFQWYFK